MRTKECVKDANTIVQQYVHISAATFEGNAVSSTKSLGSSKNLALLATTARLCAQRSFIYITIIQNENPNEKCATVRCFYKGIFKGSGCRPRTDRAARAEGKACFSLCRVAKEEDECHIQTKIRTKILNHEYLNWTEEQTKKRRRLIWSSPCQIKTNP